MMIECNIVVLFLQDLSYKRKKIRVRSLFLLQLGHYILRKHYVIWGKHKSKPLSIYKKLGLVDQKPTAMRLLMADRIVKRPIGILNDVLVKLKSFIFPEDFVTLDCEVDFEVPSILGRPFLATGRALVDMEKGKMKFQLNNEEATFNICRTLRQSGELQSVSTISHKEKMKKEREQKSVKQEFMVGDLVLLYSSRLPCLPVKLKSKRTGPYLITQVFPHGAVELKAKEGVRFKKNRDRIKLYF